MAMKCWYNTPWGTASHTGSMYGTLLNKGESPTAALTNQARCQAASSICYNRVNSCLLHTGMIERFPRYCHHTWLPWVQHEGGRQRGYPSQKALGFVRSGPSWGSCTRSQDFSDSKYHHLPLSAHVTWCHCCPMCCFS